MNTYDFAFYKKFLYEKSGLYLSDDKTYLLESRLAPVLRKWMFGNLEELTRALRLTPDRKLVTEVIDAMATNETLFFRDDRPFRHFKATLLPGLLKAREQRKSLRIWSAACSTGQEPLSIAMTLQELLSPGENWRTEILGTDISETALAQANAGLYGQFEIQRGLPIQYLMKYFKQEGQSWKVGEKLRAMVRYEQFNLLDRMDRFGTFDIIFCRNVLIYFDEDVKRKVLKSLIQRLAPDGFLFLGGSEMVINICPELKVVSDCPGLYTLGTAATAPAPASFAGTANIPSATANLLSPLRAG